MALERTATIIGASVTLVAWLAGLTTTARRVAEVLPAPSSPPVDARAAQLDREITHLAERMRPSSVPHQPGRNLFSFVARKPRAVISVAPVPSAAALTEAAPARPAPPPVKLSGIAEDAAPTGGTEVVRTAIISARGQLILAKEGEAVTDRYRVARISADVVELVDASDGSVLRLALK
jgi:hypothetical protein